MASAGPGGPGVGLGGSGAEVGQAVAVAEPGRRWVVWCGLALLLAVAFALRLWGVKQGLPYVYNIDESGHFVPKAVEMSVHGLNPRYFVNPPALTYVLHAVFTVWFGGAHGVTREFGSHPGNVYLLARVIVALLSTGAVWMLYLLGARLFDRRIGLLAAAVEAVAFLPVFYGRLALNDAVTLLPLTLSLFGSAGIMRRGRRIDYALAGLGLGFACASKYTAGIAIVPLAAALAARYLAPPVSSGSPAGPLDPATPSPAPPSSASPSSASPSPAKGVLVGIAIAAACALGSFLLANPYALLDFSRFHSELVHQSSLSEEAQGKLGAPKEGGLAYYLWSFTWGLGWAPALAALVGAVAVWRRDARSGWMLVPATLLFLAFMGLQDRYFGRWLLPIFPIACLLAAYAGYAAARAVGRGRGALASGAAVMVAAVVLLGQGVLYSVHNDIVLARADTRNLTRAWLVSHVPRGARIVLEPVVLSSWIAEGSGHSGAKRWVKYPSLTSVIAPDGTLAPQTSHTVTLEDYETTLAPSLLGWYEHLGYCWVVSGSTESGRAFANPGAAPLAIAYYRALATRAQLVYDVSPYSAGGKAPKFNFDWTFDFYPLAYERPGPQMSVYRLHGGRCS
jgi:4-amino-4-deoxy-L-arabinose transferase-like glycosyltransferase